MPCADCAVLLILILLDILPAQWGNTDKLITFFKNNSRIVSLLACLPISCVCNRIALRTYQIPMASEAITSFSDAHEATTMNTWHIVTKAPAKLMTPKLLHHQQERGPAPPAGKNDPGAMLILTSKQLPIHWWSMQMLRLIVEQGLDRLWTGLKRHSPWHWRRKH